jgi:cell fate regulator YaaT (PSP1 superfamily)
MPDLYLIEFKGNRREYYYNTYHHSLRSSEYVIVQAERGEDAGILRSRFDRDLELGENDRPRSILRPASDEDKKKIEQNHHDEEAAWEKAESLIKKHQLEMRLVDIEYQFDRNKLTFFFTADHRVDFRALVRDLAAVYRTRIELRQIGVRDEAKRLDGFGVCGLRLCCSSFLRRFEPISTQDARLQGLSLNPSKISGCCGRLLCCLKYEAGLYSDLKDIFPEVGDRYLTPQGEGIVDRISYFEKCFVVRLDSGEEVKINENDVRRMHRKEKSQFAAWIEAPPYELRVIEGAQARPETEIDEEEEAELKRLDDKDDDYGG